MLLSTIQQTTGTETGGTLSHFLASVDLQRSWIIMHLWSGYSACCGCAGPHEVDSLCCSGCPCRLSLVSWLPGSSSAELFFHLQLAVIWSHPENLWFDDLCVKKLGDRLKFVFSSGIILCSCLGTKCQLSN